jgi:hypothetical protein
MNSLLLYKALLEKNVSSIIPCIPTRVHMPLLCVTILAPQNNGQVSVKHG